MLAGTLDCFHQITGIFNVSKARLAMRMQPFLFPNSSQCFDLNFFGIMEEKMGTGENQKNSRHNFDLGDAKS
jgi:hypothetical protein